MSPLEIAIQLYTYVIFASIILPWLKLPEGNPISEVVARLTEPVLAPVRRVLPDMGGWDFSPVVVLISLNVLETFI